MHRGRVGASCSATPLTVSCFSEQQCGPGEPVLRRATASQPVAKGLAEMRDMLFLSHANPEDNDFTLWLAVQLAREGYPVWCDLTQLLGGEDFWKDAEQAIRERTIKLVYVLSKASNVKEGPLQELQVAKNVARDEQLENFIIPVLIDDLPHREIHIQLSRINAIPFANGWASGLQTLLAKLEKEAVPRNADFSPGSLASWWRNRFSAAGGILNEPEDYLTNWFPITLLPKEFYLHELRRSGIGRVSATSDLPYPAFQHGRFLVSFATADDFRQRLGFGMSIGESYPIPVTAPDAGIPVSRSLDRRKTRDFLVRLLALAWDQMITERRLPTYQLSDRACCFFFTKGLAQDDVVFFQRVGGRRTYRKVVGHTGIRFWHFGIQAKPMLHPTPAYIVKPHVLFSDDGSQVWASKRRLHRARRSHCRNWWNPDWRDRILAAMAWLSDRNGTLCLKLGSDSTVRVIPIPLTVTSPVSYRDPDKEVILVDRALDDIADDDLDRLDEDEP